MKTKKLLCFVFVFIFALSFISALEWDNVKDYNPETNEVSISNSILRLWTTDEIARVKLNTPLIYPVMRGKDRLVGEFTITLSSDEYKEFVKNTDVIDLNRNKDIDREITYKKKIINYVTTDKFRTECVDDFKVTSNGTINSPICSEVKDGTYEEEVITWEEFSPKDLQKGEVTIGVFADVYAGDRVDWIPQLFGVYIDEWAVWEESFNTDLLAYWKMDETSGTNVLDSVNGSSNATYTPAPTWRAGLIGNQAVQLNTGANTTLDLIQAGSSAFTVSFWHNGSGAVTNHETLIGQGTGGAGADGWAIGIDATTKGLELTVFNGGSATINDAKFAIGEDFKTGSWQQTVVTFDGSENWEVYWNGTKYNLTDSVGTLGDPSDLFTIGDNDLYGINYVGGLDEIGAWRRVLSASEVSDLWNDGTGITYTNVFISLTTINSIPANDTRTNINDVTFGCNLTSMGQNITSVELNLTGYSTTTTGLNTDSYNATFLINDIADGDYKWNCIGYGSEGVNGTSELWDLTIDTTPSISFENPTLADYSNVSYSNIPVNVSVTETYFDNLTFNFYNTSGSLKYSYNYADTTRFINESLADGTYEYNVTIFTTTNKQNTTETRTVTIDTTPSISFVTPPTLVNYANTSEENIPMEVTTTTPYFKNITYLIQNVNGTEHIQFYETQTFSINFTDLPDAHFHYNVTICTTTNQCNITETRHLNHDVTPPVVNITYPTDGSTILTDRDDDNLADIELNWTITDINSLDSCWYYNQTANVTIACGTNATFSLPYGTYTHIVYSNDTFGNVGSNSSTATYIFLIRENSQTFNASVIEGTLQDFSANVTIDASVEISSATLVYNNTYTQLGSISSSGQQRILSVNNYQIPGTSGNVSFYWSLVLTDSTLINLSTQYQVVTALNLDDCSVYTNRLFNITLYDEELRTPLNGTIEVLYEILNKPLYNNISVLSQKYIGVFGTLVCSDVNLTGQDLAYSTEIRYYSTNYATEFFHIQRADITGELTHIELYDLLLNDTTEFIVYYENENVVKIEGAVVQLQRKYVAEDLYREVESPLTGQGGAALLHIDLDNNKYRIVVVKDGVVLDIFENVVFDCENELSGQCEQNLFAAIDSQNSVNMEQINDFAYSISETNGTVTTIFSIPSGLPATVNIQLSQLDQFGTETLCNQTIISSSGSIECDYLTTIGESYLQLKILKNQEPQAMKSYIIPEADAMDFFGANFFIVFIFLLSIVGLAFSSPEWMIINSVMTILIAGSIWLLSGLSFVMGLGGLMWLIVAAGIILMKVTKQEDN